MINYVKPCYDVRMKIDPNSPTHAYLQLAASLREQIKRGEVTSQLPSITTLVKQTGLAVGTIRRAIDVLVQENLVKTVPGRGTFVSR
jgi:GntR family transcriptional regulator